MQLVIPKSFIQFAGWSNIEWSGLETVGIIFVLTIPIAIVLKLINEADKKKGVDPGIFGKLVNIWLMIIVVGIVALRVIASINE